jgi:hypothetical protein
MFKESIFMFTDKNRLEFNSYTVPLVDIDSDILNPTGILTL